MKTLDSPRMSRARPQRRSASTPAIRRRPALIGICVLGQLCGLAVPPESLAPSNPPVSDVPAAVNAAPPNPAGAAIDAVAVAPGGPADGLKTHTEGKQLFNFSAAGVELKTALALFARANNLNIVPDNDITGSVTLEVSGLPLEQMMRALLEASDCVWTEEHGLIRIRSNETRTYQIDYLRLTRKGKGQSSATMTSNSSSGNAGGGGGGGTGGGGGGTGGGGSGGSQGGSSINLEQDNQVDFWKEIKEELGLLLTAAGKQSMAINMTAGIIQITDRPSSHRRVADYLSRLTEIVERQVEIEAKLYDVTLGDQFQWGVNWQQVASIVAQSSGYLGSQQIVFDTLAPQPGGDFKLLPSSLDLTSKNAWVFGNAGDGSRATLNMDVVVQALKTQGEVRVVSQPRLRVMNNQTALIKVATDIPFFSQTSTFYQNQGSLVESSGDQITTITVGTILALTPQISSNNWITLDISPTLSSLVETVISPSETASAPKIDIKQASTLVRVPDGTTIVIGGLIQDAMSKTERKVPLLGDIPLLGYLFKGVTDAKQKKELVMFVTPRIVR